MTQNNFQEFTNLYELSKTLRFELKPVGNTQKMLEENKVFEEDENVAKNYKEAKKWFDKLHREFIDDTLSKMKISKDLLEKYYKSYKDFKGNTDSKRRIFLRKKVDDYAKILQKEILLKFEQNAEKWRDDYIATLADDKSKKKVAQLKKMDFFFKVEIFDFLKSKYPEAVVDEKSIFDSFNKFSTYFTGFHQTRRNFYADNGTSTAIPTRIINENLPKFLDNKIVFDSKYFGKDHGVRLEDGENIFALDYFNKCLTQEQIEKYNGVISILNSEINKERQKSDKKSNLPFFKILFKQILAEQNAQETQQSHFIDITNDEEVFGVLQEFIKENDKLLPKAKDLFEKFIDDQMNEKDIFNSEKIYVAGRFINTISSKYFADWNTIRNIFIEKGKKKISDFISVQNLKENLRAVKIEKEKFFNNQYEDIYEKEDDYYKIFLIIWQKEFTDVVHKLDVEKMLIEKMVAIDKKFENKKGLLRDQKIVGETQKESTRLYAEAALSVYQMMKYFSLEKNGVWNKEGLDENAEFYDMFNEYYQNAHTWQYFNVFRNYLTKKPYSEDKFKLNFENGTLLDGWDENKERSNLGVILRKSGKYYLGVIHKNHSGIFVEDEVNKKLDGNSTYEKMIYKQMADPKRDFPKGVFSKKGLATYKPSSEIIEIYENESFKVDSENFSLANLHKIIDFYKLCIPEHPSWKQFHFTHIKPTCDYTKNIGEFYSDVKKNTWKIRFEEISEEFINEKNNEGWLYLFEIYNKDFASNVTGKKNLHTLYWEEIFSNENLENPIIKLNGQAEIFFRKASLKKEIKENKKTHDIIRHKRYTENKLFFHCPLTLNFTKDSLKKDKEKYKGKADSFSIKVREQLSCNENVNIIGIDRGEKHLAYYSVVNQGGEIIDIGSFNKIDEIDYHEKLDELEKGRNNSRLTWQTIGKIKEMKKGYVSQVVKRICDLMVEYNAIVVFEDLNVGFKRGRFAIEKQVYQNLELALAKKLNYLVFKDKSRGEGGHHVQAFQLTPKIDNFKDIYKQCGFMFYIPASYTSAICPICGFRKNIPTPVENKEKNREYLKMFDIVYEKDNNRFRFRYKLSNVVNENKKNRKSNGFRLFEEVIAKDEFTFYSDVERLQFQRHKDNRGGEMILKYPNEELKYIFKRNHIDVINDDINEKIQNGNFDDKNFYAPIIHNIRLILQLRNAVTKKDADGKVAENRDFISCPSCKFHSEENLTELKKKYIGGKVFEFNGDANGAYNIARKGGLILKKISQFSNMTNDVSLLQNQDLTITQEEWDKFVQ